MIELATQPDRLVKREVESHRHLSTDALINAIRDASDETTQRAVRRIGYDCQSELSVLCASDVQDLQTLSRASHDGKMSVTDGEIIRALRDVNLCLGTYSEKLSATCRGTMMRELKMPVPISPMATAKPINHTSHKMRAWEEPDSEDEGLMPTLSKNGMNIYVINNRGGDDDGRREARLDHGFRHRRHDEDDGCMHPLVWCFILPFFFVGLYVATKRAIAYAKQQKEGVRTPSVVVLDHSSETEPLKIDSSS